MTFRIGVFATRQEEHGRVPLRHRAGTAPIGIGRAGLGIGRGAAVREGVMDLPYRAPCATQARVLD